MSGIDTGKAAEALLLGSLLYVPEAIEDVRDRIQPSMFGVLDHQRIYQAMLACHDRRQRPDLMSVTEELETRGFPLMDSVVADLFATEFIPYDTAGYAERVVHHYRRRMVLKATTDLVQALHREPDADPVTLAQSMLLNCITLAGEEKGPKLYAEAMDAVQDRIDQQRAGIWHETVVPTGYRRLDALLGGGFRPSETIFLGGRPGSGKTALALQLMHKAAMRNLPVLLFSAEMSLASMIERGVAEMTGLSMDEIRRPHISQRQFEALMTVTDRMRQMPVGIDDTAAITTEQMLLRARRFQRQYGLSAVFFDYLELAGDSRDEADTKRVSDIALGIQRMAKELEVPVVALSQLSRAVENRNPPIPQLSDLRQSGVIEAVADKVLLLYRQDYYTMLGHPGLTPDPAKIGIADVHVKKNRNGPTGVAPLRFDEKSMRFFDLDDPLVQEVMAS